MSNRNRTRTEWQLPVAIGSGRIAVLPAILLSQTSLFAAEGLQVGVARTDITPPVGYLMGGYSARKGGSQGIHDPLYATTVVMKSGGESLALVSLDLRSFPSNRVLKTLRQDYGIAHTLLCSTHTHSGPLTWEDKTWPDPDHSWFQETEQKVIAVVSETASSLFEAGIRSGQGRKPGPSECRPFE